MSRQDAVSRGGIDGAMVRRVRRTINLMPTAPFDFDGTIHNPSHFPSQDVVLHQRFGEDRARPIPRRGAMIRL